MVEEVEEGMEEEEVVLVVEEEEDFNVFVLVIKVVDSREIEMLIKC